MWVPGTQGPRAGGPAACTYLEGKGRGSKVSIAVSFQLCVLGTENQFRVEVWTSVDLVKNKKFFSRSKTDLVN